MADREAVTIELDIEVAALLKAQAEAERVSEGEIVERAVRALDLRALLAELRERNDLDEDAALRLASEELRAARAERASRAA